MGGPAESSGRLGGMIRIALIVLVIAGVAQATPATRDARTSSAIDENDDSRTTLTLCFEDTDVPPWRWRDGTGHNFRLLDAVAEHVGVRFRYVAKTWRGCQSSLARGKVDGAFALSYTLERRALGLYSPAGGPDPDLRMFVDGYVLVVRRGSRVSVDDGRILGLRQPVGSQPGYSIVSDLRRQGYVVDEAAPDTTALLLRLAAGHIDGAAIGMSVAKHLEATGNPAMAGLEVIREPLVRKDYFLMLSNPFFERDPETAKAIWQAVSELRDRVPENAAR